MSGPAEAVKFREFVFVSDGRWRVEINRGEGRKSIVFAYDGRSYFSNSPGKSAQDFNPVAVLEPLYASFPDPSAMPVEILGGIRCWRYTEKTRTTTVNAWIDTRSRLLRKLSTTGFGAETTDIYEPITVDPQKIVARILDPEPMLIQ